MENDMDEICNFVDCYLCIKNTNCMKFSCCHPKLHPAEAILVWKVKSYIRCIIYLSACILPELGSGWYAWQCFHEEVILQSSQFI